jgi:diguanylate cyclase (GGDEF)-like protein/PAS domain S-box-containing protein
MVAATAATSERGAREAAPVATTDEDAALLALALSSGRTITWVWDIARDRLSWTGDVEAIYGPGTDTADGSSTTFLDRVHPDDLDLVLEAVQRSVDDGVDFHADYRCVWTDGTLRWHSTRGRPVADAAGQTVRLLGVATDVTEQRQAEAAVRESELLTYTVLANAPVVLVAFDAAGIVTLAQGRALRTLQVEGRHLLGTSLTELVAHDEEAADALARTLAGESVHLRVVVDQMVFEAAYRPIHDGGAVVGGVMVATDVTERVRAEEQLTRLALHDPLTELPNRVLFTDRLEIHLARQGRRGGHLAVLFLDLDRFKQVNDTFGHHLGDELLRQVAAELRSVLRAEDTLARFGGDEFLVVAEVPTGQDAADIAERLLGAVRDPFTIDGRTLAVGASIGVVVADADTSTDVRQRAATLVRQADAAMYQAKQVGRGRYHLVCPAAGGRGGEIPATDPPAVATYASSST